MTRKSKSAMYLAMKSSVALLASLFVCFASVAAGACWVTCAHSASSHEADTDFASNAVATDCHHNNERTPAHHENDSPKLPEHCPRPLCLLPTAENPQPMVIQEPNLTAHIYSGLLDFTRLAGYRSTEHVALALAASPPPIPAIHTTVIRI